MGGEGVWTQVLQICLATTITKPPAPFKDRMWFYINQILKLTIHHICLVTKKSIGREEEEVLKERQTFSDTRREPSREEEEEEEEATSKSWQGSEVGKNGERAFKKWEGEWERKSVKKRWQEWNEVEGGRRREGGQSTDRWMTFWILSAIKRLPRHRLSGFR